MSRFTFHDGSSILVERNPNSQNYPVEVTVAFGNGIFEGGCPNAWVTTDEEALQLAHSILVELPVSSQMTESVMAIARRYAEPPFYPLTVKATLMNPAISGWTVEEGRVSARENVHARICIGDPSVSVCYTVSWEQIARAYFFDQPVEINN